MGRNKRLCLRQDFRIAIIESVRSSFSQQTHGQNFHFLKHRKVLNFVSPNLIEMASSARDPRVKRNAEGSIELDKEPKKSRGEYDPKA